MSPFQPEPARWRAPTLLKEENLCLPLPRSQKSRIRSTILQLTSRRSCRGRRLWSPPIRSMPRRCACLPRFEHNAGIRKVINDIPVRKPHSQEWIRVHPGQEFSGNFGVIILKDDNEFYLLHPNLVGVYENEMTPVRIFTCMSMNKNLFMWAAKLPGRGHKNADRWANSAIEAAEAAMKRKVRVQSNKGLGAYEFYFSDNPTPENDPVWPADLTFDEMLRIAFAKPGRFIDSHNHEVIRILREGY